MTDTFSPLDALHPHDPAHSEAQLHWLLANVTPSSRVLDLGSGGGRTLVPLAASGAACTGVDCCPEAMALCRSGLQAAGVSGCLVEADVQDYLDETDSSWDVICCLGNTLCLFWEIDSAIALLRSIRRRLAVGGVLVIDDIPGDLWPELSQGCWQEGLDAESGTQLIWADDDSVFALRSAQGSDPEHWSLAPDDRRLRLWTAGALVLLARVTGYEDPIVPTDAGVRVLTPAT